MAIKEIIKKTILITGVTSGLGYYLANRFYSEKHNLILILKDKKKIKKIKNIQSNQDQKILKIVGNISDLKFINSLKNKIKKHFLKINILINNAATQKPIGKFIDNNFNFWKKNFYTNFFGPIKIIFELMSFLQQRDSLIVNISGGGGTSGRENFSAYGSSKTALIRFSEILALELKKKGIRINSISPGLMKTGMTNEIIKTGKKMSGNKEYLLAMKTLKKNNTNMSKVFELIIFLLSKRGKSINGKILSAIWDNHENIIKNIKKDNNSYTLRRYI
jgi:NAD(P)-dependent dehydrogenase (short-subunit alcohol dehydrogenase family)